MAAHEYVKAAAAQLNNAATAVKLEADQMRADLMRLEREITHDIDTKDQEMHALSARAALDNDSRNAAHLMARSVYLKKEIEQLKSQLERQRAALNQAIKGKEGAMNALKSQASGLQSQASNF